MLSCLLTDDNGYASLVDSVLCPSFVTNSPKVRRRMDQVITVVSFGIIIFEIVIKVKASILNTLKDAAIVITGISRGLGNALANHFAKEGFLVIGSCRKGI